MIAACVQDVASRGAFSQCILKQHIYIYISLHIQERILHQSDYIPPFWEPNVAFRSRKSMPPAGWISLRPGWVRDGECRYSGVGIYIYVIFLYSRLQ